MAPVVPDPPSARRITIADAIKVFLGNRAGGKIAPATLRKYRTFTKQLTEFAESRGYVMLDQFASSDIDIFYGGLKLGVRAKGERLGTFRAFFRFAVNRKWLAENPVTTDIKPPIGANRVANKAPFTDEELQRIIDACDKLGEVSWTTTQWQAVAGAFHLVFLVRSCHPESEFTRQEYASIIFMLPKRGSNIGDATPGRRVPRIRQKSCTGAQPVRTALLLCD